MQDELGFPDKQDPNKWGVAELKNILHRYVVTERNGSVLHTFGCLEWKSEFYRGVMLARCSLPSTSPRQRLRALAAPILLALIHANTSTIRGPSLHEAMMPLFLRGNFTPTIQCCFQNLQHSKFPQGCALASIESGRKGSKVYELNQWLWEFGRGKSSLGGSSVEMTEEWRISVMQNRAKRGHATKTKETAR